MNRSISDILLIRVGFVALIGVIAAFFKPFGFSNLISAFLGLAVGGVFNLLELRIRRAGLSTILGACLGSTAGGLIGLLFVSLVNPNDFVAVHTALFFRLLVPLLFGFLGLLVGIAKSDLINPGALGFFAKNTRDGDRLKLLDTSVLIDGRVAEIVEAGFLEGHLIIPQFVLHELQLVADSSDSAKRNRGRRGLDIVGRLQKMSEVSLEVSTTDYPSIREVDLKLIEVAKARRAKLVTNDFNLNKLAQVQGLAVLNINELANSLRPVALPGELMRVFILKEGKEYGQGVAYLEDGTMVVVDNARRYISKTLDVVVTTVLQTTAGKMIFAKYDERPHNGSETRAAAAGSSAS